MGNRHMSVIIFLESADAGGDTVFPTKRIKVSPSVFSMLIEDQVSPKKGDAVFFLNLRENGFVDHLTYHGGCPVEKVFGCYCCRLICENRAKSG